MSRRPLSLRAMGARRLGFTLIELVVVVVIIFVLFGSFIAIGNISGSSDYEIRKNARLVAGTMEQAKQQSAITGSLVKIVYDFDRQVMYLLSPKMLEEGEEIDEYDDDELFQVSGSVEFGDPDDLEHSKMYLESVQTYDGKTHDGEKLVVEVRPAGSSIGHVVNLVSRNDEEFSIELNPVTGIAYIYEYRKEVSEPERDN